MTRVSPLSGRQGVTALVGALALGCSAEVESYATDAETGSSAHALVTVQRSISADGTPPHADVLAGFVRVPAHVEPRALYELLGLRGAIPALGQCRLKMGQEATPSLSGVGRVELLEAGDVWVGAQGSEATLAPHAFPTVIDQISGVLYASRDRSPAAFPAASSYNVRTAGGPGLPSLSITKEAPLELDSVTVGGVVFGEVKELATSAPIDVTWGVGAAGDVVVAELATSERVLTCSFRDEAGAGSIPAGKLDQAGAGRFSLHRVRTTTFRAPGVDHGELAFQFELGTSVSFKP